MSEEEIEFEEEFTAEEETGDLKADDLSDSDDELEEYKPLPYAFILKDVYRRPLLIKPEKLYKARVTCPPFHILLDHVVAVLWCFYSQAGHHLLGTSQLHWAILFLEGLHDRNNRYTPDVGMAIENLEEALVEVAAAQDENEIMNRTYQDLNESVRPFPDQGISPMSMHPNYNEFEASLLAGDMRHGTLEEMEEMSEFGDSVVGITGITTFSKVVSANSPSLILDNILEDHPDVLLEITRAGLADQDACSILSQKRSIRIDDGDNTEDLLVHRRNLIDTTIRQLEEIKNLDETLRGLCPSNTATTAITKDLIEFD